MSNKIHKIPKFDANTGWLLPGIYLITLDALLKHPVLGKGKQRQTLIKSLVQACETYWRYGITEIYINGSFATVEENPNDIDGCIAIRSYSDIGFIELVNSSSVWGDFSTLDAATGKQRMWMEHKIEFYVHPLQRALNGMNFLDFYTNPTMYVNKGILKIIKR